MRRDFSKLVHERGRACKGPSIKTAKRIDVRDIEVFVKGEDNEIVHTSVGKQYQSNSCWYDYKQRNEYTSPWNRFLKKNIGRPWDEIYSELRVVVDSRTDVSDLIASWIYWNITFDCFVSGKKVVEHSRLGGVEVFGFYVHPITGVLCNNPYPKFKNTPPSRERMANHIKELWVDKHCQYTLVSTDYPFYSWRSPKTSKWYKISWKYVQQDQPRFDIDAGKIRIFKKGERVRWSYRLANSKEIDRIEEMLQAERQHILATGKRLRSKEPENKGA